MPRLRLSPTSRTTDKASHASAPAFVSPRVATAVVARLEDMTSALDYGDRRRSLFWDSADVALSAGARRAD